MTLTGSPEAQAGKEIDLGLDKVKDATREELAALKGEVNAGKELAPDETLMADLLNEAKKGFTEDLKELGINNPEDSEAMKEYVKKITEKIGAIKEDKIITSEEFKALENYITTPENFTKLKAAMDQKRAAANIDSILNNLKGMGFKDLDKFTGEFVTQTISWIAKMLNMPALFGIKAMEDKGNKISISPPKAPETNENYASKNTLELLALATKTDDAGKKASEYLQNLFPGREIKEVSTNKIVFKEEESKPDRSVEILQKDGITKEYFAKINDGNETKFDGTPQGLANLLTQIDQAPAAKT